MNPKNRESKSLDAKTEKFHKVNLFKDKMTEKSGKSLKRERKLWMKVKEKRRQRFDDK